NVCLIYGCVILEYSMSDPCDNYNVLDEYWRSTKHYYTGHDDTIVEWNGWYRLFLQGASAQMPEWCVSYMTCGGYTPLALGGAHPQVQDGIVIREVYGSSGSQCTAYRSNSIQVKACPGNYYVYKLVKPDVSVPMPSYCAVTVNHPSFDPCNTYTALDQPWRASNETGLNICDSYFNWNGWYRLFSHGMNTRMPESCVGVYRCGTYYTLWLNGPHPQIEDGVVTRQVCGNTGYDCYYFRTTTIQVKACPGNYYVYELVRPQSVRIHNISSPSIILSTGSPQGSDSLTNSMSDPCDNYNVLDEYWRTTKSYYTGHDDTIVEWNGWYRLFLQGASAQMPEWCVSYMTCGGYTPLALGGAHPQVQDGIVIREVYGSSGSQCTAYRSNSIQVKACPGNYYVYKLVKPDVSVPMPSYCAVTVNHPSFDPCNTYTALDQPWRASNETGLNICDSYFNWNGWYRLFSHGMNTRMPESCVGVYRCGTYYTLWLNGPHPQIEDGVVTQIYGSSGDQCKYYRSNSIQVKACPGQYYVYELVTPNVSIPIPTYCAGHFSFTFSGTFIHFSVFITVAYDYPSTDPCDNYNVLDQSWRPWRATDSSNYWWGVHCDQYISWNGWYRLLNKGNNVRMPDSCVTQGMCGTHAPLWLNGSHPRLEDGMVSRQVCGNWNGDCCYFKSFPIQVKACPGNYYVYEFVRPVNCHLAYCAGVYTYSYTDPCAELECTADEWCGEKDNIYGCFCNENHPRPKKESYDSKEECESSSGTMSLSRCQLFEAGFSADVLHLSDPNCTGTIQNGRLVFSFDNDANICGTNLVANGTHFIYENTIQGGADSARGSIHRKKYLELQFSCIYQISQTLSMDTELTPLQSVVRKRLPGQGMYQVRIIPYQDAALSQPYNGSVKIVVDERIYVGVFVQGVDSRQIATVIDSCWATPENDQNHAVRWDLITNRCPNPEDTTVEVLQNGVSTTGLFSFRMFAFNGDYQKVFLHCSIHLCILEGNNCAARCFPGFHHRVGRSVDIHDMASISVGPFIWTV
uniref:ZP domain-containing protein n=1 Tax=Astyanax mexicanus TaxID=7994 RepID=A0A3B1K7K0_ASTMX